MYRCRHWKDEKLSRNFRLDEKWHKEKNACFIRFQHKWINNMLINLINMYTPDTWQRKIKLLRNIENFKPMKILVCFWTKIHKNLCFWVNEVLNSICTCCWKIVCYLKPHNANMVINYSLNRLRHSFTWLLFYIMQLKAFPHKSS